MKTAGYEIKEAATYRLIEVPVTQYRLPYKIQRKVFGFWFTVNRFYLLSSAENAFDIYANHAKKKLIKSI